MRLHILHHAVIIWYDSYSNDKQTNCCFAFTLKWNDYNWLIIIRYIIINKLYIWLWTIIIYFYIDNHTFNDSSCKVTRFHVRYTPVCVLLSNGRFALCCRISDRHIWIIMSSSHSIDTAYLENVDCCINYATSHPKQLRRMYPLSSVLGWYTPITSLFHLHHPLPHCYPPL